METARLVAFAFGVYLSGALFALAARRLWLRWNVDAAGLVAGWWAARGLGFRKGPRGPGATSGAESAAPQGETERAQEAPLLDLASALEDPLPAADGSEEQKVSAELSADDVLAQWLLGDVPEEGASELPVEAETPPPDTQAAGPGELERSHRLALELALSEIAPLEERLGFLARHVRRLEGQLAGREANAAESAQLDFARHLLVQQAELAAVERRGLVDELAEERAAREAQASAEGARWSAMARRLRELDGQLVHLESALRAAEEKGAQREQQLEEAKGLVRAERDVADRIRGLLAGFGKSA